MKIKEYGILGLARRAYLRVGKIFDRSERYSKLLSNTFIWQIKDNGILSEVHLNREAYRRGKELSTEASLSATVVVLQAMTEQNITTTRVSFKHSAPFNRTITGDTLDCFTLSADDIAATAIELSAYPNPVGNILLSKRCRASSDKNRGIQY